jgi:hypothetical protein
LGGGVNGTNITKNLTVFSNGASTPQWYLLGTFDSTANPSSGASFILEVLCSYGYANNPTGSGGNSGGKTTIYGRSLNNASATYANLELSFKSEGGTNAVFQVVGVQVNAGTSTTARNQYYVYAQMSGYNQGALNVEATTFGSFFTVNPTLSTAVTAPSTTNSSTVIPGTVIYTTSGANVGIGTTSPGYTLDVNGSMRAQISGGGSIYTQDTTTATSGAMKLTSSGGANFIQSATQIASGNPAPLHFTSMNTAAYWMTLSAAGYLGIGTVNPIGQLHLYSTLPTSTTSFSRYGQLIVDCARSGAMGGTITVRNSGAGALGSAASIAFEVDGSTAYDSGGLDEANARISCVIDSATNNPGAITFNTWNGSSGGERVRISSGGYVGIGTTNPLCPLHVGIATNLGITGGYGTNGGAANNYYAYMIWNSSAVSVANGPFNYDTAASIQGYGIRGTYIVCYSDERIKTNIDPVPVSIALDYVRQLTPVTFNYKDTVQNSNLPQYGFIAQDVEKIVPYSTHASTNTIPNIYENATVNGNILTLNSFSTSKLEVDLSGNLFKSLRLYDTSNNEINTTIVSIIDDKKIEISELLDVDTIFVYGQEVDNYRDINYNALFTLTTSAVKEIDTIVQSQQQTTQTQQSQIQELQTENTDLKSRLAAIESRLSAANL